MKCGIHTGWRVWKESQVIESVNYAERTDLRKQYCLFLQNSRRQRPEAEQQPEYMQNVFAIT
ncbi:MAG: hypothetical protein BHW14_00670 [Coprococcus sp. 43_8]|nr:MAG: hypothetical protein BHW14_00670 [Coprococcus sp. 43_8]